MLSSVDLFSSTYVFVDALDECDEVERQLLVAVLSQLHKKVKVFVTSRPGLARNFGASHWSKWSIPIRAQPKDIMEYIRREVKGRDSKVDKGLEARMEKRILLSADGS